MSWVHAIAHVRQGYRLLEATLRLAGVRHAECARSMIWMENSMFCRTQRPYSSLFAIEYNSSSAFRAYPRSWETRKCIVERGRQVYGIRTSAPGAWLRLLNTGCDHSLETRGLSSTDRQASPTVHNELGGEIKNILLSQTAMRRNLLKRGKPSTTAAALAAKRMLPEVSQSSMACVSS